MNTFHSKAFTIEQVNNGELDAWLNHFDEEVQKSGKPRSHHSWEIEHYVINTHFVVITIRIHKLTEATYRGIPISELKGQDLEDFTNGIGM